MLRQARILTQVLSHADKRHEIIVLSIWLICKPYLCHGSGLIIRIDEPTMRLTPYPSRPGSALWRSLPFFMALGLGGCTRAPLQDVLGSFFPSWMLCATIGAVAAALLRAVIGVVGLQQAVPAPMLTYLAFMVAITFMVWLVFFGH